jgi:hypothetical protein
MKPSAIDWLMKIQNPAVPVASTDVPDRNKKPGRGFDSPLTAEVLCPIEYPATARYTAFSMFCLGTFVTRYI